MEAVASGLAAGSGLDKPGARVGVYGANCREWMVAMQARAAPCAWPLSNALLLRPDMCAAGRGLPARRHLAHTTALKRAATISSALPGVRLPASVRDAHAWP